MKRASGSGLFLLETMISILFFLIAAAVCTQVFVRAHLISKESGNITYAQANASCAAELLTGTSDPAKALAQYYDVEMSQDEQIDVFFDKNWEQCSNEEASFRMHVDFLQKDNMQNGEILVETMQGDEIYRLETMHYLQQHI